MTAIDKHALESAADTLTHTAVALAEQKKELREQGDIHLDYWIGRSADKWGPEFEEWFNGADALVARLGAMGEQLGDACHASTDADNESAADIGSTADEEELKP